MLLVASMGLLGRTPAAADDIVDVLTLPEAIETALKKHPALQRTAEQVQGAEYARQSAKADFLPSLSADYSYTAINNAPFRITSIGKAQVAHTTQYRWGLSLTQPLFTGGKLSSQNTIAKLRFNIAKQEKKQAALDITKGVKSAYYRVLLCQKQGLVADEVFQTLSSHEKDAQMFFERGIIRRNDLLRAQVALSNAVQFQERTWADVAISISDLNRWMAGDINAHTRIADIDAVSFRHFALEELIQTGLDTRPRLKAMALTAKALTSAVTMEKSARYPSVAAVGNYYRNGDSPDAHSNDFENDHNASLYVQATWTLFDSNRTRSRVSKAESDKRAFDQSIREIRDLVRLEIKSAYLNLGVAENNIDAAKTALSHARENMRITRMGYRQQAATSTEVLDARSDLTQVETNYYQSLYGYLDALAALERAVGKDLSQAVDPKQQS